MSNDGGPAFPMTELDGNGQYFCQHFGMSLRDYFAAKAMAALMSTPAMLSGLLAGQDSNEAAALISQAAYEQADAMIAQRGK